MFILNTSNKWKTFVLLCVVFHCLLAVWEPTDSTAHSRSPTWAYISEGFINAVYITDIWSKASYTGYAAKTVWGTRAFVGHPGLTAPLRRFAR